MSLSPLLRYAWIDACLPAPDPARLDEWLAAGELLLAAVPAAQRPAAQGLLHRAWEWNGALAGLAGVPRERLADAMAPAVRHLGPGAMAHLLAGSSSPEAIAGIDLRLGRLAALDAQGLRDRFLADTSAACTLLLALRDPTAYWVSNLFREPAALAVQVDPNRTVDRERAGPLELLDHLADRVLGRKLAGLESGDIRLFQCDNALSEDAFRGEVQRLGRLRHAGLLPIIRAALIHLDFAKGGSAERQQHWRTVCGADLSVHNVAARRILEHEDTLRKYTLFRQKPALAELVLALVESHGLCGQVVRGETPMPLLAPWVRYLRTGTKALGEALAVPVAEAIAAADECLHFVNLCDTAGVREGLLTDALAGRIAEVERRIAEAAGAGLAVEPAAIEAELAAADESDGRPTRARLADRLARLRRGRIDAGEPRDLTEKAVGSMPDDCIARLSAALRTCQFWYAEPATSALSPEAQLKVLALGMAAAEILPSVDTHRPYHVSLWPLLGKLGAAAVKANRSAAYRVRLVEAMLAPLSVADILAGKGPLGMSAAGVDMAPAAGGLGVFTTPIGGTTAVALDLQESEEARALLTLLGIYETKSSAAFHATLKTLCDVYGLRKDEFDRVANEAAYLEHMNSARSDKSRMLDHVRPGLIVEVGPGGGIVLDLLEARFPESRILGLDASRMVVEALSQRKAREGRRWEIIEADAFRLPEFLGGRGADTVIFCSVLHEIYSYVEYPADAGGAKGRFRREAVRDMLRSAYAALAPGGRIVIRDGVMPPPGNRIVRFLVPEAREFFELFAKQFEARPVRYEAAGPDRVRLSSADAMEFLYKYTWGPESFPYEVREQYGVMPYEEYRDAILGWLAGAGRPARWVALPPAERSYLQNGYRKGLAGKVELFDADGSPAELPDSNCLLIFEKT